MKRTAILKIAIIVMIAAAVKVHAQPETIIHGPGQEVAMIYEMQINADNAWKNFFRTDSAYVYRWDLTASDWQVYQVQYYGYTDGRLTELLTRNHSTGANVALSVYTHNASGRTEAATNYSWAGDWVLSTRYLYEYDSQGRTASLRLQKWANGAWMEERLQQNYQYDAYNRTTRYETVYWRNNEWTLPTVSELSYNALGQLEYHIATRPGGNIDYRIVYEYNEKGLMTQFYTQYPAGEGWSNWNLRTLEYDACGRRWYQTQYSGEGPNWTPNTRNEFFTSFNFDLYTGDKLPVCHRGMTRWISVEDIQEHLEHGDCIGECLYEKEKPGRSVRVVPFTVYPNPAKESFTVQFKDDCFCDQARIDLTDFSGNLIRSYIVTDNSSITVERGDLKSGHYFVRFTGDEVYTLSVILK